MFLCVWFKHIYVNVMITSCFVCFKLLLVFTFIIDRNI